MKKIKTIIISIALLLGLVAPALVPAVASAQNNAAKDISSGVTAVSGGQGSATDFNTGVRTVINMMLFILGIAAVVVIIIGGFRYVTSNGDANATKAAKDTILYAVVGLIVAILAYAIVNFVISAFGGSGK